MPAFPSVEWFEALRERVNADPAYRKLGTCEARVGFLVGRRCYRVVFDAFRVGEVSELDPRGIEASSDFVLEMGDEDWRDLIRNVRQHGRADAEHTLNTLVFPDKLRLRYRDSIGMDKFYQYNQSLQHFLDSAAGVDTVFG